MINRWTRRLAVAATVTLMALTLLPPPAEARGREGRGLRGSFLGVGSNQNLVEKLDRLGNFNILITAVETAGLAETLAEGGEFTVFAPTDEAFADLLADLDLTAGELLGNTELLTNVLLYHVLPGKQRAAQLLSKNVIPTLFNDQPVLVTLDGLDFFVNDSEVTRANIRARNGIIHEIDKVLLPPEEPVSVESMLDVLRLDGRFTILLTALDRTGLDEAFVGNGVELTLFAPTDEAFADLLATLGASAGDLLANPDLPGILLYHVLGSERWALSLLLEGSAETLQGDTVIVNFIAVSVKINDSRVVNANVSTPTGIIHVIDAVLLP